MSKIAIFDVETTGTNPERDQVIELCIQIGLDSNSDSQTWRIKPAVPVSPAAERVHGISNEDLKNCKPFSAYSKEIRNLLESADVLAGYNISFDLAMIQAEYARLNQEPLSISEKLLVDPYHLWRKFEPRDLSAAHTRFVGKEFSGAHAAKDDVAATGRVLQGMLKAFKLEQESWDKISDLCEVNATRKTWVGPTNHFRWEEKKVVFGFGKHRSRPIEDVAKEDNGGYLNWLATKDFPEHVKLIAKAAANKSSDEFSTWVKKTFGETN